MFVDKSEIFWLIDCFFFMIRIENFILVVVRLIIDNRKWVIVIGK